MNKNDPAFPRSAHDANYNNWCGHGSEFVGGLTKLEWFAGMALQAMTELHPTYNTGPCNQSAATRAFDLAEAMIIESEKRK